MTENILIASRRRSLSASWSAFTRRHPDWAAWAAAAWSAAYGVLGLLWALGAGGFPFGVGDREAGDMTSLLVGVRPESAGPVIAVLGAVGAVVALLTLHVRERRNARAALLGFSWLACISLIFLIPDVRLMRDFGYLFMLNVGKIDWPTINQVICVAGGLLWAQTALRLQRRGQSPELAAARADDAWERWGRWATLGAVLFPLPYELIRWAWAFAIPLGVTRGAATIEHATTQARVGMFVLGLLPLIGGILTHGLVRPWGEVYPRWFPRKAGRRMNPLVAVVPGTIATIMIVAAGLIMYRQELNESLGRVPEAHPEVEGWGAWLPGWFWLPWGVALGVATYAYHRRRRRTG